MRQITFNKITIKNFLSVGSVPVSIDFRKGLHIITGINKDKDDRRNGVGKSTIADAIYFAVFGESLRELKKEFIVNNINKKNCEIVLEANIKDTSNNDNIIITRTLEPSKCFITINGDDKTRDSISNTNQFIQDIFKCTPEIFQNCVIMTINNTVPFMAKKKAEKRKFIEDIFNLGIFGEMTNLLRFDLTEKKKTFDIESAKHDEVSKTIHTYEKQKEFDTTERIRKHQKYKVYKESNSKEVLEVERKLKEFTIDDLTQLKEERETVDKKLEAVEKKIQDIRNSISENKTSIMHLSEKLKSVGTDKDKCPVCLRSIEENDKEHIKTEKKKVNDDVEKLQQKITIFKTDEIKYVKAKDLLEEKLQNIKEQIHAHAFKVKEKSELEQRHRQLQEWQASLDTDINELVKATNNFDVLLKEQQHRLAVITKEIDSLKLTLSTLDIAKFVLSEEGVKSYIVKKILQLFNSKLAYYLKKMDANCTCIFNEYFEEEIIDNKGKVCSYFNFSGAERKNIDLSCLFAFMDIRRLQGDVSFNFSIYDELFDSSLDERGVELVINILKERVEKFNESIMIISHRKESIKAATGDIIFLEKINGITKRVDYKEYTL